MGALLLAAVDRRIGLVDRLTGAIVDSRHASYIIHPLRDLLSQRLFQVSSGYKDGNDANGLRRDPLFKIAVRVKVQRPGAVASAQCLPDQGDVGADMSATLSGEQGARHAGFSMTRHVWPMRRCRPPLSTTT